MLLLLLVLSLWVSIIRRAPRASWRLLLALGLPGGGGAAWRGADVSTAEEPLRVQQEISIDNNNYQ